VMVLTPALLVFGESLPKEFFRLNADRMPYRLAPVITACRWLATATLLLPVLSLILRAVTSRLADESGGQDPRGRRRLMELLEESAHQGAISGVQGALAERALVFERTAVRDVMIAWSAVDRVRLSDTPERAAGIAARTEKTWLPVVDHAGSVAGVVHAVALLERPEAWRDLIERPTRLGPRDPLRGALARLSGTGVGVGIVEERGRPVGLVGKRDLVRPLIGVTPI